MLGKRFGTESLVSLLLREEGREVREYLTMHRETAPETAGRAEALQLAKESAEHATELAHLAGVSGQGEPWHRVASGGFLRNVVYGFNDGLTANFGLVAGVLGATATQQHEAVVVAGVAGVIADALSMGSSGYLAAKSELEVHAHEIAMERDEIAYMPELERDELALIYEAKGMDPGAAHRLADEALKDPERMLQEKVQSELGLGAAGASPLREGWITGTATAIGALLPVFPFFMLRGLPAIVTAFARCDGGALPGWCGAIGVHRARPGALRDRHVRRRPWRGGRRVLRGRLGRRLACELTNLFRQRAPEYCRQHRRVDVSPGHDAHDSSPAGAPGVSHRDRRRTGALGHDPRLPDE